VSALAFSGATNGTSTNSSEGFVSDSTTAATFTVSGLLDAAGVSDTLTVSFVAKSVPAGSVAVPYMYFVDSATSSLTLVDTLTSITAPWAAATKVLPIAGGSDLSFGVSSASGQQMRITRAAAGYVGAKFAIQLDSATARAAGTYTYTAIVKGYSGSAAVQTLTQDVSIVVPTATASATTVSALTSFARMNLTSNVDTAGNDAAITSVSTASSTPVGYVEVGVRNAADGKTARDSVTATITGAGILSTGSVTGSSFKIDATGDVEFSILPDGRAGVATITISTNGTTYAPKTVTFFAKAAKTITATVAHPVLKVGANAGAVSVAAVDANGTNWTGTAYIVASSAADALVAGSATTPVACAAWNSTDGILCPVTAVAAGTAKLKVIDASTVAAATATSNEITVTASTATASAVKLAFDKATYAPFEKATITVTPVDATGKNIAAGTLANLLATGGITSTIGFSANSDTLTAVSYTTSAKTGSVEYTVYMPAGSGDVTISATGGTSLPAAGQVKVSATTSVVNSSVDAATDAANEATDAANAATDAALAAADAADAATAAAQDASDAVAALSASVSKLISSLRAQITSLTNLVIKIQKKVRA
jgi:hypothetical protein